MLSIFLPNSRDSLNASGSDGSNFPVSIAFTLCRDTSSFSARSACDQPLSTLSSRIRLRIVPHPVTHRLRRLRHAIHHEEQSPTGERRKRRRPTDRSQNVIHHQHRQHRRRSCQQRPHRDQSDVFVLLLLQIHTQRPHHRQQRQ